MGHVWGRRRIPYWPANLLGEFQSGLYDIEFDADVSKAKRLEFTVRGKAIRYDVGTSRLSCEKWGVTLPTTDGRVELRILVDNCSIDIHAGADGQFYIPMFFGPLSSKKLGLRVEGDPIRLDRLHVHQLKSIWN